MLNIINNLKPFFEDCYREISVREYSRLIKISPPTASKLLGLYETEGLLKKREDRGYLLFRVNRDSNILKNFSRIYWESKFVKLFEYLDFNLHTSAIILFGSLSKLETKKDSDIDLVLFSSIKNKLDLERFEKQFKREIQIFYFDSIDKIKKELRNNILNGFIIVGEIQ